jgi:hypothetical protein
VGKLRSNRLDAQTLAQVVNHPNIVAVYDTGQHEGAPYVGP